jgi:hypothetical protein
LGGFDKMANFLVDSQVSLNAATSGSIAIPVSTTPELFGTLGLNTSGAGADLRVVFDFTVAVSSLLSVLTPLTVTVNRIVSGVTTTVYTATETLPLLAGVTEITLLSGSGVDYHPPNPGFIIYQALISVPGGITLFPTRVGPESFTAEAYSDFA